MNPPRRYSVRHETIYDYGGDVAHSHQLLRLTPRDTEHQSCLSHALVVDPQPRLRRDGTDAFGNRVTWLETDGPLHRLHVTADLQVLVSAPPAHLAADGMDWRQVAENFSYRGDPLPDDYLDACRFRMESPYVRVKRLFADYAADCFIEDRSLLDAALRLMHKLHHDLRYAPGTTNVNTSILEAFHARTGVCQDFAHIMLACLRSCGFAARYVSGYLRTTNGEGDPALVGADATHAWVAVFCPPFGWVDLDPTNDMSGGTDHVTVAWGRDFGDVSPLRGVIVGGGEHRLQVRVSVRSV